MKILSGKLKGKNFYMPSGIRPTQGLTRKAIFDLLGHDLSGVDFLDLFAGSGAVGLEAISHGAQFVTFVEKDAKCLETIEENLRILGLQNRLEDKIRYEILTYDAFPSLKLLDKRGKKFHAVFLDPPYGEGLAKKALKSLVAYDILHPDCYIIAEHSKREILPESEGRFFLIKQRNYGKACLSVYKGR
jgi:16S rRNA (guanine966-N2)-methyltransferase